MMSIKVYSSLKTYGERIFEENVDRLFDLAKAFAKMIQQRPSLELALEPEANIVNFRIADSLENELNTINSAIRKQLLQDGKFYMVQTTLNGKLYLRCTIMNPLTTEEDLEALLDEVESIANFLPPKTT
jgi:L-2,4-diaminobutyrate decarboxylase